MKKRYIVIIIVVLVILGLVIFKKKSGDSYTQHVVEYATVTDELKLAGTIEARKRVDLGFANSGRVSKNSFIVGDVVKKGDIIAEIDQNQVQSNLIQAQANYEVTRVDTTVDEVSTQDNYENQIQEQQTIVDGLYQQYLNGDLQAYNAKDIFRDVTAPTISGTYFGLEEGSYFLDVYSSSARSGYSFRLSGLTEGTYTAETSQPSQLGTDGLYIQFTEGESYGNTQWIVSVPNNRSATYVSRKTAYENSLATQERIIADAANNLTRVTTVDTGTSASQARRDQARAQVSAVYAQLEDGKIIAPFDGIIARNELEVGEIVNAFSPEVVLFADDVRILELNVPEIYINKVQLEDSVSLSLDAYADETFDGTISFIDILDTVVDGVPVYQTDITITQQDPRVRVGMNARASIISDQRADVLAIPAHYVQEREDGTSYVLIMSDERFEDPMERTIEIGFKGNDGMVEIVSGLNEGDTIVLKTE